MPFFSETGNAIESCENTSELTVGCILENKIFKLLSSDAIALSPTLYMTDHSKRMWRNSDKKEHFQHFFKIKGEMGRLIIVIKQKWDYARWMHGQVSSAA